MTTAELLFFDPHRARPIRPPGLPPSPHPVEGPFRVSGPVVERLRAQDRRLKLIGDLVEEGLMLTMTVYPSPSALARFKELWWDLNAQLEVCPLARYLPGRGAEPGLGHKIAKLASRLDNLTDRHLLPAAGG